MLSTHMTLILAAYGQPPSYFFSNSNTGEMCSFCFKMHQSVRLVAGLDRSFSVRTSMASNSRQLRGTEQYHIDTDHDTDALKADAYIASENVFRCLSRYCCASRDVQTR